MTAIWIRSKLITGGCARFQRKFLSIGLLIHQVQTILISENVERGCQLKRALILISLYQGLHTLFLRPWVVTWLHFPIPPWSAGAGVIPTVTVQVPLKMVLVTALIYGDKLLAKAKRLFGTRHTCPPCTGHPLAASSVSGA